MQLIFDPAKPLFRGPGAAEDFTFAARPTPRLVAGASVAQSHYDATLSDYTAATTLNEFQLAVSESESFKGHSFTSETPSVCTVDSTGQVSWVGAGNCSILVNTPIGSRRYQQAMNSGSNAVRLFGSFKAGSLGEHVTNQMLALINGKAPGYPTQRHWSSNNHNPGAPAATRNGGAICAAFDMSGISMTNLATDPVGQGDKHPGILVTDRHIVGASHYPAGSPMVFLDNLGIYHQASVLDTWDMGNDIHVAYLDTPLLAVGKFRTLPANYTNWMKSHDVALGAPSVGMMPALTRSMHAPSSFEGWWNIVMLGGGNVDWPGVYSGNSVPAASAFHPWSIQIQGGDSGSPIFIVINGEAVLVSCFFSAGGNTSIAYNQAAINTAMNTLAASHGDPNAGTYAIGVVDLSAFTQFLTP